MKAVIVNGSPRKNWNTAQLLKEAQKGAESAGYETEYIDLYDLQYHGCRSCLVCKRRDNTEPWKCCWKDDLSEVLDKILQADRLIIGTPIYYAQPVAEVRSLVTRLAFPAMSYNDHTSLYDGKLEVDVFLTMNVGMQRWEEFYEPRMREYFAPLRYLNGQTHLFPVVDTLQVEDYSLYEMRNFDEAHKKERHETEFPRALECAYKVGQGIRE